jgi:hypothetical protein
MGDFGSWQGPSEFATGGIAQLFRGLKTSKNAARGRKMPFTDGHDLSALPILKPHPDNRAQFHVLVLAVGF